MSESSPAGLYFFRGIRYNNDINQKGGERMTQGMSADELKLVTIDCYVNLQRIKKADTCQNPELEYQLKVVKNKLAALGIPSEEYEM